MAPGLFSLACIKIKCIKLIAMSTEHSLLIFIIRQSVNFCSIHFLHVTQTGHATISRCSMWDLATVIFVRIDTVRFFSWLDVITGNYSRVVRFVRFNCLGFLRWLCHWYRQVICWKDLSTSIDQKLGTNVCRAYWSHVPCLAMFVGLAKSCGNGCLWCCTSYLGFLC